MVLKIISPNADDGIEIKVGCDYQSLAQISGLRHALTVLQWGGAVSFVGQSRRVVHFRLISSEPAYSSVVSAGLILMFAK